MPQNGDRVFVRPRHGLQVQRGEGLYGQFIPAEGMYVMFDDFIAARIGDGSLHVVEPEAEASVPEHGEGS